MDQSLTGSIGVVTVYAPDWLQAIDREDYFELARSWTRDSLEIKRKYWRTCGIGPIPLLLLLLRASRVFRTVLDQSFLIGLVNNESLKFLRRDIGSEARPVAWSNGIMQARIMTYQEETGNLYNLETLREESATACPAKTGLSRHHSGQPG